MSAAAPDGGGLAAIVARLAALTERGADRGQLAPRPPHPDAALLDLLDLLRHYQFRAALCEQEIALRIAERARRRPLPPAAELRDFAALGGFLHERAEWRRDIRDVLRRAATIRATTFAGVTAKAQAMRLSRVAAAGLAQSLADDLAALPAVRKLLWPAEAVS